MENKGNKKGSGSLEVEYYLKDEMKRLNRMNDLSEKKINQGNAMDNEPEQIVNNVKAMCEIAKILRY